MDILDKFRSGKKRPRPVGQSLEKGRDSRTREKRRNIAVKGGIILGLVLLTLAAFPRTDLFQYRAQVGDVWRQETFIAPTDFALYKAPATIEAERQEVRLNTPPFFRIVPDAQERIAANRDTLDQQLRRTLDAYASFQHNKSRGVWADATADSLRYIELRRNARLKATPEQWALLAADYTAGVTGLESPTREQREGPRLDQQLLQHAWEISMRVIDIGVLDVARDSVLTDEIIIRNEEDNLEQTVNKENLYGLNEAYAFAEEQFANLYDESTVANLGAGFFRAIFSPSLTYMRSETVREWQRKEQRISPTRGKVSEGEVIVAEGQVVTHEIRQKLASLERYLSEGGQEGMPWRVILGQLLVTLATYIIFFLYLFLLRRQIFDDNRKVLLLALLFGGIIGLFAISIRLENIAMYAVPVAIAPVLLTVMFDSRVGLFGGLTLALIGAQLLNYDFEFAFATIFATTLGVFSVRDIKNRGQFFLSAGLVFLGYLIVLGATAVLQGVPRAPFFSDLLLVAVNSFLLILAYPLLWVFERAFDITTDLSLLELSDTNRPLIKELSLRAPGTFNHSLQVANLAEAAADAVGANALLSRVGGLYHDIGKMLKPEYFVENQRPGDNPHNQLKPRMSALIIASHVKEGLEMGRQYNLPKRVLDFIPMHHGTTRIEYFYRKALEQQKEADPQFLESEFRYPGPRPDSKETGIMMLADSVEAASRSLSDPTHKRLETLIDMIFKARTEDGQLDSSDLTFRDLSIIRETFLSMLLGIYHVRVKYPGQDAAEKAADEAEAADQPAPQLRKMKQEGVLGTMEQGVTVEGGSRRNDENRELLQEMSAEEPTPEEVERAKRKESQIFGDPERRARQDLPRKEEENGLAGEDISTEPRLEDKGE